MKNMNLKEKARIIKREIGTLYYAYKDKRTPIYGKVLAIIVVAYALSPIDLIPDFIPVLGYLDDVILLPLGIYLTLKVIPSEVVEESRAIAVERFVDDKKANYIMACLIGVIWVVIIYAVVNFLLFK